MMREILKSAPRRIGVLRAKIGQSCPRETSIDRQWMGEADFLSEKKRATQGDFEQSEPCPSMAMLLIPYAHQLSPKELDTYAVKAIEYLQLDHVILQRWYHASTGWNFFSGGEGRYCFLVFTPIYKLAWSFDPVSSKTRALLLAHADFDTSQFFNEHDIVASSALEGVSICHPMFLAHLALLDIVHYLEARVGEQTQVVQTLDFVTGHGIWAGDEGAPTTPDSMIAASKKVGGCVIRLTHMSRMVEVAGTITDTLGDSSTWRRDSKFVSLFDECAAAHDTATRVIRQDLLMIRLTIKTLEEAAKTLSTLIFSLLAREDTRQSYELAMTSKEIAEAAKQDSSAMKTIAIMTMAFLPATFFAALFAMPSLQWDQDIVITNRFWVYWAFTLPATLLVFMVWYFLTKFPRIFSRDEPWRLRLPTTKRHSEPLNLFELQNLRTFPQVPGESLRNPDLLRMRSQYRQESIGRQNANSTGSQP
ncbi:hypothetical protein F4778DRAFT_15032 [Xylariomycetidae sp. FL2044]|nr:hypothetical protein F4778DRAFT_15032 [Xylariomycetidae sp. FL2044]